MLYEIKDLESLQGKRIVNFSDLTQNLLQPFSRLVALKNEYGLSRSASYLVFFVDTFHSSFFVIRSYHDPIFYSVNIIQLPDYRDMTSVILVV